MSTPASLAVKAGGEVEGPLFQVVAGGVTHLRGPLEDPVQSSACAELSLPARLPLHNPCRRPESSLERTPPSGCRWVRGWGQGATLGGRAAWHRGAVGQSVEGGEGLPGAWGREGGS